MMDINVSAGAPATDAVAVAKSGRQAGKGDASGNGGFADVLNKANGSNRQGAGDQSDGAATSASTAAPTAPHKTTAKPIVDVSDASLVAQVEADVSATDEVIQKTADVDLKNVRKKISGKTSDADADKVDDELAAHATKNQKPAKTDKTETTADVASDGTAASDVLSLLKQAPVDTSSAAAAAAALAAQKQVGNADPDPKDKSSGNVKSTNDAVSDVASALTARSTAETDVEMPATEATDSSNGQTFRLTRADGRSVSMDVHLGNDKDTTASGKADVESVTILDSRRYIGLAQNTNSAAVTAAISGDSEWAHAMQASSALSNAAEWTSTGKVVNTLKIQMNPIDLGLVTATMRLQGDALNVDLKVETGAAYRQLKEDHSKILESLRSQGYTVDNITISMAPVATSDTSSQTNTQGQSQQQAFAQNQGGEARERQNQSGQRNAGGFNVETGVESASSGNAGSSSTGDVYL
ncbi:flagellar hook-length control protein [Rhizobium sp. AC44/96]|uniref:flagellar hook-length control protein FliK n=1 Tax=Rhizobium sp. AC44/96 TaxID=1841654 RepID=UPI00080F899D|nr:flagellar hook-length control protein FliK [Rhizobium sp. AC44/96]OCJ17690.1 flagellar hook-length control protein [Rhizobium sp. AC44/96]